MKTLYLVVITFLFCISAFYPSKASPAEGDTVKVVSPTFHHEVPGDRYTPVNKAAMPRSPGYRADGSDYFTIQVNTDEEGNNIVGDAANKPSGEIS